MLEHFPLERHWPLQDTAMTVFRYELARALCAGKTVLEVGAASGEGTALLAGAAKHVTALDRQKLWTDARTAQLSDVDFVCRDVLSMPAEWAGRFDVVIAMELIEHVEDVERFQQAIFNVLAKDGLCLLSTPNFDLYSDRGDGSRRPLYAPHLREYRADEIDGAFPGRWTRRETLGLSQLSAPALEAVSGEREVLLCLGQGLYQLRLGPSYPRYTLFAAGPLSGALPLKFSQSFISVLGKGPLPSLTELLNRAERRAIEPPSLEEAAFRSAQTILQRRNEQCAQLGESLENLGTHAKNLELMLKDLPGRVAPKARKPVKESKFSVIIVNYNGMAYWPGCLSAIRRQTYGHPYEVIVVNNASTDGSREYLLEQADVHLIDPGVNTGFSRGQNLGILAADGEYVLCLNFDCFLEPDFLEKAAEVFRSSPEVGAVSGKLKKLIKHEKSDLLDSTGISFRRCLPSDRGEWKADAPQWSTGGAIFGPSGAAACYRRSALEDVRFEDEYFDEDMFIYCEDIDLAWRLNLRGWKGWYEPSAVAYHERGSTRKDSSWESRNYFIKGFRNRYIGLFKNLRWDQDLRKHGLKLLFQETVLALGFAWKSLPSAVISFRAVTEALPKTFFSWRMLRKRRLIQKHLNAADFSLDFSGPLRGG